MIVWKMEAEGGKLKGESASAEAPAAAKSLAGEGGRAVL
jgi:hypothetical protein